MRQYLTEEYLTKQDNLFPPNQRMSAMCSRYATCIRETKNGGTVFGICNILNTPLFSASLGMRCLINAFVVDLK